MNRKLWILLACLLTVVIYACTPKTEVKTAATEKKTTTPKVDPNEKLSPCKKFSDASNPDEAETNYVLYRDFLRTGQTDKAFEMWKKVYQTSPAADGRRNTVYADGIEFYEYYAARTQDEAEKNKYVNQIFEIYDEIDRCYPEGSYVKARKAFDYFYKYQDRASKEEMYTMFKEVIDADGMKTPDFVINPFTSLLVDLYFDDKITKEEANTYQGKVRNLLSNGLEKCKGVGCERWAIIEEYVPARLEAFETVKGFYDCAYYKEKYYKDFLSAQNNCDTVRLVYSRLKWGGCSESDAEFQNVIAVGNDKCVEKTAPGPARVAYECLQNADYSCAVENFQTAANETSDDARKANYLLVISKIYYAHLKNFSRSRQYAQQAADARPNWGEPYILIGKLYASSGPLCGSGRGWNSQIVTWPAIDMWNKAKRVDSSVAGEANRNIGRYTQYMPTREDIFQRNLKEGDAFRVGCWINETTTIRAAPN